MTFLRRRDADEWALATEHNIDPGVMPNSPDPKAVRALASPIDHCICDHQEIDKPIQRSKANVLEALCISFGDTRVYDLKRSKWTEFGKRCAIERTDPAALAFNFPFLGTLVTFAAAAYDTAASPKKVKLARIAVCQLGAGWEKH